MQHTVFGQRFLTIPGGSRRVTLTNHGVTHTTKPLSLPPIALFWLHHTGRERFAQLRLKLYEVQNILEVP